jgi:hypothetical protein
VKDPRNQRFYKLRKREPNQLSPEEAREVLGVCVEMMDFARSGKMRKHWEEVVRVYEPFASKEDDTEGGARSA